MRSSYYVRTYQSVEEMIDACDKAVNEHRSYTGREGQYSSSFIGRRDVKTWDDAKSAANGVWQDGLDEVQWMLYEMRNETAALRPVSRKRKARWSADSGDEVDNDRLRSGQDYWRETRRQPTRAPQTLAIVVDITTSSSVNHMDILWRGAAGIVLADLLEAAGFRVELWAVQHCNPAYTSGKGVFTACCLKHAETPVDIPSIVNGISAWFYRTIFFQAYFVEKDNPNCGLGRIQPVYADMDFVSDLVGNADVEVIDRLWDRKAAIAKVRDVLQRYSE